MATPTLVQSATAASSAASPTSITPTLGSPSTAGNFLILVVCVTGTTPTITTPAGWTAMRNTVNNSIANGLFTQANNAGGITSVAVTVGGTGGGAAAAIFEFNVGANPSLESQFANANAGNTIPRSNYFVAVPDTQELLFAAMYFAAATVSNTTGTTSEWQPTVGAVVSTLGTPNAQLLCFWGVSGTNATPNVFATLGTSVAWLVEMARFYIVGSNQPTYTNVGGMSGQLVGQFFQGMIGG